MNLNKAYAIENGDLYYFTGNPCKRGHISKRFTRNGVCYECHLFHGLNSKRLNKESINLSNRIRYSKNKDIVRAQHKNHYKANKPQYMNRSTQRRIQKTKAAIFSEIYKDEIESIYLKCKLISELSGVLHHVDHIVPINHPLVTGLHVPWNLRIITALENLSKSNRFEVN